MRHGLDPNHSSFVADDSISALAPFTHSHLCRLSLHLVSLSVKFRHIICVCVRVCVLTSSADYLNLELLRAAKMDRLIISRQRLHLCQFLRIIPYPRSSLYIEQLNDPQHNQQPKSSTTHQFYKLRVKETEMMKSRMNQIYMAGDVWEKISNGQTAVSNVGNWVCLK